MTSVTWFICGVRCAAPTTCKLTLESPLASPVALAVIARRPASWSLNQLANGWQVELDKGDHILQVTAPLVGSDGFKGVTLTKAASAVASFNKGRTELQAWIADTLTTQYDPKDPWPPPAVPLPLDDAAWFTSELTRLHRSINVAKGVGPEPEPAPKGRGSATVRRGSTRPARR